MKLNKIKVGGFRNISETVIELNNITALVSLNSYGKSNVLQAINFGIDFIKLSDDEKKKMMSWIKGIPLNKTIASKDYEFELDIEVTIDKKIYNVIYGYKFMWVRDDNTGKRIVNEWLKVKLDGKNQKYNSYITRNKENSFYKTSETGRCTNRITVETNELIINKLKAYDKLFYIEIIKKINNLSVCIERYLDVSSSYILDPFIRIDMDDLEIGSTQNIPRVIFHLKKQYPEKYKLLLNSFMQLFPQIIEIEVRELSVKYKGKTSVPRNLPVKIANQLYVINVIEVNLNQPINFECMSDGAKRVFLLLTFIIIADINGFSLIAIEEPENSIHPGLLQSYLRVISQFSGDCKVIITSHSPYIIQYLELSNIYIGLPASEGIARFSRIRKSKEKTMMHEAGDMSIGDYIFDLLSGSEDDLNQLATLLEDSDSE